MILAVLLFIETGFDLAFRYRFLQLLMSSIQTISDRFSQLICSLNKPAAFRHRRRPAASAKHHSHIFELHVLADPFVISFNNGKHGIRVIFLCIDVSSVVKL